MNEASFWQYLRNGMRGRWHPQRIESATALGIPDLTFGVEGKQGWIELKYVKEFPKRATTSVNLGHLTDDQIAWIRTRGELSGDCWLFVRVADEFFIFSWWQVNNIKSYTQDDYRVKSLKMWSGKLNFEELQKLLKEGC